MELNNNSQSNVDNNDETLKQIYHIFGILKAIVKKYFILLLIPIILSILYSYKRIKEVIPNYSASISFSLSEDRPQIELNTNPFLEKNSFNNPVILREYSVTEKVGSRLLFKKYLYNRKEDYLINHYLRVFSGAKESYFHSFTEVKNLNIQEYTVFKRVLISLRQMLTIDFSKAEIYYITIKSSDENFSILLCNAFYENLIDYYIERTTKKEYTNAQFLEKKLTVLKAELEKSEYNLAHYKDRANNLVTYKAELEEIKYKRNKMLLEKDYMETAGMLEIARTKLQAITPLFQIIDEPHLPLDNESESKLLIFAINLVISIIIVFVIIGGILIYRLYMPNIKEKLEHIKD